MIDQEREQLVREIQELRQSRQRWKLFALGISGMLAAVGLAVIGLTLFLSYRAALARDLAMEARAEAEMQREQALEESRRSEEMAVQERHLAEAQRQQAEAARAEAEAQRQRAEANLRKAQEALEKLKQKPLDSR